mmetsp:Transcript_1898/g.7941  ORF Transcript_1898/g.7941 Transcript_1898/m.7941 type:complete len:251 (+) Transcript_1898:535-1287(+)
MRHSPRHRRTSVRRGVPTAPRGPSTRGRGGAGRRRRSRGQSEEGREEEEGLDHPAQANDNRGDSPADDGRGGPRVDPVHAVRLRSGGLQPKDVPVHARRELLRKVLQLPRAALALRQRVPGVQLQEWDVQDARVPVLRRRARVRSRHLQALLPHRRDHLARAPRRVAVYRHLRARAEPAEPAERGIRRQDRSQRAVRQHEALPPAAQARVPRSVGRRRLGMLFEARRAEERAPRRVHRRAHIADGGGPPG